MSFKSFSAIPVNTVEARETGQASLGGRIQVLHALHLCYPSLLQAVERISVKVRSEHCGVYNIVLLFQNILGHLHAIAGIKAGINNKDNKSVPAKNLRSAKHQCPPVSELDELCVSLTKVAIQFFEGLDLSLVSQISVLEGLICVFLDHLGSSLSLVVFADVDAAASRTTQLGILPPRGLLDTSVFDQEKATRTVQHEARYLVAILRHLILCIDKQQTRMGSESAPLLTWKKSLNTSNRTFAKRVRDKLQITLLRGVFGDDDEVFKDALQKPVPSAVDNDVDVASNGDQPGDWFIGEVWRILGWNILTGQSGDLPAVASVYNDVL